MDKDQDKAKDQVNKKENINFLLFNEINVNEINVNEINVNEININDLQLLNNDDFPDNQIVNEDIFSVEELEYYYKKYTVKDLIHILNYYGLQKNKMNKDELIQMILFYEIEPENNMLVQKRRRLWQNILELKADLFFNKFILF